MQQAAGDLHQAAGQAIGQAIGQGAVANGLEAKGAKDAKASLGQCKICTYAIEEVKLAKGVIPEGLCEKIFKEAGKELGGVAFEECSEVVMAASVDMANVNHWISGGCFKLEGSSLEQVKPCPSRAICTHLQSLNHVPFCKAGGDESGGPSSCTACKAVVQRVKQGYGDEGTLQDVCVEFATKGHAKLQPYCEMVLNSLTVYGKEFKGWLDNGCTQTEKDGEKELLKPCPDERICETMKDLLSKKPYCAAKGGKEKGGGKEKPFNEGLGFNMKV